ncbi:MAG: hypothetical protein UV58_C0011G0009 [Candidatus Wolfebacteria bacterium GW2011_GWC1_43_10]|uniref:Uncharacterized protein n=1 Tax=Candidatus Wolfebacteria bacterium GW2011_GWC1_43_10 TaxID=1619011 RepID=A0A0G1C9C6_9BACT|nr:MAG: hypothetical protein UV58_C0011G0009 [Candidatus Wolfebacteria bacterium GW2011_GWC1_43_10]KKT22570.1 MAG: hypothetical protein UW08_C0006G0010 [Parcubacteria group bacterium GW2011_GWB1_43_8b]
MPCSEILISATGVSWLARNATLAQLVEHIFRKDGVPSSNLGGGSELK